METHENKDEVIPAPSISPSTVTVAISGSKNSKYALTWALEKFIPEGRISFRLLHVHPKITMIPTPMGNSLPISKVRDDIVAAYRKEIEWQTNTKLLPFKQMCAKRQVEVEILLIESDDIAHAISEDIAKTEVTKLVIGSSSRSIISRHRGLSRRISSSVPNICTVYVVSKGKLSSIQSTSSVENGVRSSGTTSFNSVSSLGSTTQTEWTGMSPSDEDSQMSSPSMLDQHCQALSNMNRVILNSAVDINHSRNSSLPNIEDIISLSSGYTETRNTAISASIGSFSETQSWISDQATTSDIQTEKFSASQLDLDLELEKLRIELRHAQKMCSMAEEETADVSRKVTELSAFKMNEASKLEEISCKEEMARESAKCEREKREAAEKEAEFVKECAERELMQRRGAESRASQDVKEKNYIENTLQRLDQQYKKFSWEEIVSATSCFSDSLRIGGGAYGTVYKCRLHHTTVAVKVLQLNEEYKTKQFHQELEVLSKIRHPHLLLLLGACPDHGCLVYEFMENGSLDDRLFRQGNSPSIPWFDRFRIAWEIGSALHFLHNSKPKPIVHRDLKPANILLDHNLVSKIGDVGLATTLLPTNLATGTAYKNTALAGTFCYIDPEYQRTGLVSSKSDLYALGVVILQLLTAKHPMGLAHLVETALLENRFEDLLDVTAGEWPLEETQELAALGLSCAELRRSDRPDLGNAVLPMLERLKGFAETARVSMPKTQNLPPSHFVCPILQDVMQNPCVAADGYTYERRAIEKWLSMNDKSPLTNLPLPNKFLIPNYSLLGAIREWRSKTSVMLNKRS